MTILEDTPKPNILLKPPEQIADEDISPPNHLEFEFELDNRTYTIGYRDGRSYFHIEYVGEIPNVLTEEERSKFLLETRIMGGEEKMVYTISYGYNYPQGDTPREQEMGNSGIKRFAKPRDSVKNALNDLLIAVIK